MPRLFRFPAINFTLWVNICALITCILIQHTQADDFDNALASKNQQSTVTDALSNSTEPEFLPVTEAYKLSPTLETTGATQTLKLTWNIAPGYYLYQERFKFKATPEVNFSPIFSDGGTEKFDEFAGKNMTIFHDKVAVSLTIPTSATDFKLKVTSQGCAEAGLCYPPYSEFLMVSPASGKVTHTTAGETPKTNSEPIAPIADQPNLFVWQAILFAFLGGMILNLMPCVFPVLSFKAFSLIQAEKSAIRIQGWAYTLGVLVCFGGFSSLLLAARQGGEAIGWGFQLQSPALVIALTYLFFVMGLSMSGLVQFGGSLMGVGQSLTEKSGLQGSFFTGVLAAVVASPCTAPFMGAALGFALTQPAVVCLAVFLALGFGMAFPLLAICYIPALANRLPRPGAWMETVKEVLAFPLYISAIWLLWVLTNQRDSNVMAGVLIGAVAIAFACWLWSRPTTGLTRKIYAFICVLSVSAAIALPFSLMKKQDEGSRWQAYSPELLADLRAQGRPVFIDLTADWCITCLANEKVALSKAEVIAAFESEHVATLKGDWTNRDEKISELLKEYGRSGVPLYLWYPANRTGKADVLPQILTPSLVIDTISTKKPAK